VPINLNLNLSHLINRFNTAVMLGVPEGLDDAALLMKNNILRAFAVGGPGWRPLSQKTLDLKRKSKSPNPTAILREFNIMRDSIDIKNESHVEYPPAGRTIPFSDIPVNHVRSVGLFSDTAKKYDPNKEIGFRGPLDVVKRGTKHEFGGIEFQSMKESTPGVKEIRTEGLTKKALKGEGVVAEARYPKAGMKGKKAVAKPSKKTGKGNTGKSVISKPREVKQKIIKPTSKKLTQVVYIPERSFLRMPFDISEESLVRRVVDAIRRRIDNAW